MKNRLPCRTEAFAFFPGPMALAIASTLILAPALHGAHAQTASTPANSDAGPSINNIGTPASQLEQVNVTARRTQERALDVPLTLSTITGATLENTASTNIRDILNLTPGLTATTGGAERNVVLTIRSVPDLSGGANDPDVAVFVDGIYQQNRSAISIGLLDLLRVEVIKGPVSALYGRNAFSGVINYVTTPPQNAFEASAQALYGDYGLRGAKVSIGGPLGAPELLGRLVYAHEESGGTYRDSVNGLHAGGYRKDDVLASVTIKPLPKLTINGSFYYGDDFFDVTPATYLNGNCGTRSAALVSAGQFSNYCGRIDPNQNPVEVAQFPSGSGQTGNQRRVQANSLKFAYDLNIADVSALFGYDRVTQIGYQDFTFHRNGIPFLGSNGQLYTARQAFGSQLNDEDGSMELRLSSKQDQPIRGSVGFYYFNARSTATTLIGVDGSGLPPNVTLSTFGLPFTTPDGSFSKTNYTLVNFTDRVRSPFASGEVDVLPGLTALLEARYTMEDKGYDIIRNAFVTNTVRPFGAAGNGIVDFGFKNYRTSLRYKITPDAMVYASLADGTKAGGINQRAAFLDELSFAPETNVTYEVGTKAALLDNRVQFGASLFNIVARNLQVTGPSVHPTNTGFVTTNVGRVKSQGIDLDVAVVPIRGLTLTAGAELANSSFSQGVYDFADAGSCVNIPSCASRLTVVATPQGNRTVVNLSGLQAPRSSKFSGSLAAQYNGQLNDQWNYFGRVDFRYESKQYEEVSGVQYSFIDAKKLVNLNAGIGTDRYKFTAFVKNLTNNNTPEVASPNTPLNGGATPYIAYLPQKRTFGLAAQISY